MSNTPEAILFYGYRFTDEEGKPWDDSEEGATDLFGEEHYFKACGIPVPTGKHRVELLTLVPCEVILHGEDSDPAYGVAVKGTVQRADWNGAVRISPDLLSSHSQHVKWLRVLEVFCERMGIEVDPSHGPGWWLVVSA